ncbi:hypothetical protein BK634_25280 [Pseudomonas chlororaphis]|nr:hypothetical protein BK634_25280 [Pseudomonas chlororaphis]
MWKSIGLGVLRFTSTPLLDQLEYARHAGLSLHSLVLMGEDFLKCIISLGLPMKDQIYLQMLLHFVLIVIAVPTILLIDRNSVRSLKML